MRKIVFIGANEYVPWGGSESLWSAAAERFARRGVQVYVSVKDWGKPVEQVEYLRSVGCKIVHRRSASLVDRLSRKLFRDVNLLGSMSGHLEPVQEYFRAVYERYHQAGREAKHLMLNEFWLNTGYHRKYAIRLLDGPPPGKHRSGGRADDYGGYLSEANTTLLEFKVPSILWRRTNCGEAVQMLITILVCSRGC